MRPLPPTNPAASDRRGRPGTAGSARACCWSAAARWEPSSPSSWSARASGSSASATATSSRLTNLQRQMLFDEADAAAGQPKAIAAAERLAAINSSIAIEPHVVDVHSGNIEVAHATASTSILDGTDNVETRYLINDAAVKHRQAVGVRRVRRNERAGDGDRPGPDAVPAMHVSRAAGAGRTADLRHRRRAREPRRASSRRSRSSRR